MIKSFFGWPGGKQLGAKYILPFIPTSINKLCSPFLGGGTIELNCAYMGMKVYGYDILEPLVNFWQVAIDDHQRIKQKIMELEPKRNFAEEIIDMKLWLSDYDQNPVTRAAAFIISVECSYGNMVWQSFFEHPRCRNLFKLEYLNKRFEKPKIKNMIVAMQDFEKTILNCPNDTLIYLDPPYYGIEEVYSKKMIFDHEKLARLLIAKKYWILSYNGIDKIRDLYNGYYAVDLNEMFSHSLKKRNRSQNLEILIFSKGYVQEWGEILELNCAERL